MALHLIAALLLGATTPARPAERLIPPWARKYNMNCSGCHTPNVPRLNSKGYAFKWAGYRMPEEIGEDQEVKNLSDYLGTRFRFSYVWNKAQSAPATDNSFSLNDQAIFAGGPIGKNLGVFLEFAHTPDGVELVNNLYGVWGKENQFVGARVGQMHWLFEGGVAGFDRTTGISDPTPLADPLTAGGSPFAFGNGQVGLEAFFVKNKNRFSVEVLNGVKSDGMGDGAGSPSTKDYVVIDQLLYDTQGSGLTAVAYFGSIKGLDPAIPQTAHYQRFGLTANKRFNGFEALGGYVLGKDYDLPVGTVFTAKSVSASGFWGYGGYTFPSTLTAFGRYEFVNSNIDVANSGNIRYVAGAVMPFNLPEYLRMTLEYTLDSPRGAGGAKRHGLGLEAMLAF